MKATESFIPKQYRALWLRISLALIITGITFFYMLPFAIALGRNRTNTFAIFILNLLLGWTGIGWIFALIWAVAADKK